MAAASTWERCATLDSPMSPPIRYAAPTQSIRSPQSSTSTRCGGVRLRPPCCQLCVSSGSRSWLGRRWRGFLTGTVGTLDKNDFRQHNPRYAARTCPETRIALRAGAVRRELSITPAQLALAWLLHQGRDVIPIPGTRKRRASTRTRSPPRFVSMPNNCVASMRWLDPPRRRRTCFDSGRDPGGGSA